MNAKYCGRSKKSQFEFELKHRLGKAVKLSLLEVAAQGEAGPGVTSLPPFRLPMQAMQAELRRCLRTHQSNSVRGQTDVRW